MALVSPGVEVSVVDQSQYLPAPTNSVPYILIATAQDKTSGTSTATASGTTLANANKINLITSQRELVSTYGNPTFYNTSAGTPINAYELNEYGLLAAYSVLGISNRAYVQRVNVDTNQLAASLTRPLGASDNNSYWLDATETQWGIHEWTSTTSSFNNETPTVITSTDDLAGGIPKASIGAIGDYAVVATNAANPVYYKNRSNAWVLVGSDDWHNSWPTVQGTVTSPLLTIGHSIVINGTTVTNGGTTATTLANAINSASIAGVTAAVVNNKIEIYADSAVSSDGSSLEGALLLANGSGTILTDAGLTANTYYYPRLQQSQHYSNPRWASTDTAPRPTGSVWIKTTAVNNGADITVKNYNSTTELWSTVSAPLYENDQTALKNIDPAGGGINVAANTLYVQYDSTEADNATYKIFKRYTTGATTATSTNTAPTLTNSDQFTISASVKNSTAMTTAVTATISGTTAADFVAAFNAANVANTVASVVGGAVRISHSQGGVIVLKDSTGTPLVDAGITSALDNVKAGNNSDVIVSNYVPLTYTASLTAPTQDPANDTYWYHSATDEVDILIQDGGAWKGYQSVSNDARGFDLSQCSPAGPIVSATAPTTQSDASALVYGDLWISTADLDNYPKIYRWEVANSVDQWVALDNSDQTTQSGVLFADARWGTAGTVDPVTDDVPTILSLLTSTYVDIDAPTATLYPEGTLLFNTRRSGNTVKQFKVNYFNSTTFPNDSLPTQKDAWVNASGNKADGSPYMGRKAVRKIIVGALEAGIDANTSIREEQKQFNLLAAPGYPELIDNLVALNNDRNNTGFVIGDTPFRLSDNATDVVNWATDANGAGVDSEDGLSTADPYVAVFYPNVRTNDLAGNKVVAPASHAMLRTLVKSDEIGYPWLAPAGGLRGTIDNAEALGYVNAQTGEFQQISVRQALRDTLYENKVNPLTFVPGSGLQNYGNKTVASTPSALDRINVARLVAYVRDRLEVLGKSYIFEPNDTVTRNEVKNACEQLLNDITAKRGVYDYLVVCDDTNNTAERIDRNELYVDIAIEPTKSVEFIYIPLRIKNTGDIEAGNL